MFNNYLPKSLTTKSEKKKNKAKIYNICTIADVPEF